MHSNCTASLLNLEGVQVQKVIHADTYVKLFLRTKPCEQTCPVCGECTSRIHDYRDQVIKDIPFQEKPCLLVLHKRRYRCTSCGKRFYEPNSIVPRYLQRTARLTAFIASCFTKTCNISEVAERTSVSTATVGRILDTISFQGPPSKLPKAFAIDEFKGNAETGKYQVIISDPIKHRVLDIVKDRSVATLTSYFKSIPRKERLKVEYFVSDMYKNYIELAKSFFPNATIIIDKYHFIRQVGWAIEGVRKRIQKNMEPALRRYYKRSRKLILTRYSKLKGENKQACDLMLQYSEELRLAHRLKERFYDLCQTEKYSEQRRLFRAWIIEAESCGIKEFANCAKTYQNWSREILNAFKHRNITNGPTEGFNNRIKVLKRSSYGIRKFERFRTRILMATS